MLPALHSVDVVFALWACEQPRRDKACDSPKGGFLLRSELDQQELPELGTIEHARVIRRDNLRGKLETPLVEALERSEDLGVGKEHLTPPYSGAPLRTGPDA